MDKMQLKRAAADEQCDDINSSKRPRTDSDLDSNLVQNSNVGDKCEYRESSGGSSQNTQLYDFDENIV